MLPVQYNMRGAEIASIGSGKRKYGKCKYKT